MWTDDFLIFDDVKLHYVRTRRRQAPLLLLHGITDSVPEWARFARTLEADYDLIMLDTRGHGLSSAPPPDFTLREQAHDVAKLIKHLGIERASVIGHSMGATTAMQLAALHPDLVVCACWKIRRCRRSTDRRVAIIRLGKHGWSSSQALTPEERLGASLRR